VLSIKYVSQFKRDLKRYQHQHSILYDLNLIFKIVLAEQVLPQKYLDHALSGDYMGMRECHVRPDVLLIYWIDDKNKRLVAERFGSHAELFK